jgi:hypothetical protein
MRESGSASVDAGAAGQAVLNVFTAKDARDAKEKIRVRSRVPVGRTVPPSFAVMHHRPMNAFSTTLFFRLAFPLRPWRPLR